MSGKADFSVCSLTQIAFANEKLPFVLHPAKVNFEPNRSRMSGWRVGLHTLPPW
ncbi:hypothetical protein OCH239_20330 [Roseivivax halodurans JCM 10272]|uniref:Uncharacterized protein n=1 Tax=Roseivivax halodurans JCM 10272 TaxID=1449350 RepID=X7E560_9RHOB|nr:hypothetical protein [Roseivivax halodurans]ETX10990.1 hypothetical protein OCH239_20330 [Roseivivax halodurans JCM 10272]